MATTAQLHAWPEFHYANPVAVLLAEESDGAHSLSLVHSGVALLLEVDILANELVNPVLHFENLLVGEFLEVREVETKTSIVYIRAFLLHVRAQNLTQGLVHKVSTRVVVRYLLTSLRIHHESKFPFAVLRKLVGDVHDKIILMNGIEYHYLLAVGAQGIAGISYLTAHLSVERSALEHELKHSLVLLNDGALLEKLYALDGSVVVAVEHALAAVIFGPIPELIGRSVTRAVLLLLKSYLEAVQVYLESFLCGYHLREVYRESVGIVEDECVLA